MLTTQLPFGLSGNSAMLESGRYGSQVNCRLHFLSRYVLIIPGAVSAGYMKEIVYTCTQNFPALGAQHVYFDEAQLVDVPLTKFRLRYVPIAGT